MGPEFRTRPPQEHDAIRQRVAEDLKRIESTAGKPEADFLVFLRDGQKQSGASKERINAIEDRVLREYPRSSEAYRITYERWRTGHEEPEDHKDRAAWAKYDLEYRRTLKQWIEQFTEDRSFGARYWYYAISRASGHSGKGRHRGDAAQFLIRHKWQPERALGYLRQAGQLMVKDRAADQSDNLTDEDLQKRNESLERQERDYTGVLLQAALLAGKPAEAASLKKQIETAAPTEKKQESAFWLNRARLAALENRRIDALAYYQSALFTCMEQPRAYRGYLQDDLLDEARAL